MESELRMKIYATLMKLKVFLWQLQDPANLSGEKELKKSHLEGKDRKEITDMIIDTYHKKTHEIMKNTLEAINMNNLAKTFGADPDPTEFVIKNRHELIFRVMALEPILDQLMEERVIHRENFANLRAERTRMGKMRILLDLLTTPKARAALYRALKQYEPFLLDDLQSQLPDDLTIGLSSTNRGVETKSGSNKQKKQLGTPEDDSLYLEDRFQNKDYPLIHTPRGKCLIINNENFKREMKEKKEEEDEDYDEEEEEEDEENPNRIGTQIDADALESVFSSLGFEVEIKKDLTKADINDALLDLSVKDFSMADALVVCVLSHGGRGCVYGTDWGKVPLSYLKKPFRSQNNISALAGKPKLFFIQACQGKRYQKGVKTAVSDNQTDAVVDSRFKLVADDADFLTAISTVHGFVSVRNRTKGSIFIQALCRQLQKLAKSGGEDIHDILTRVNREVSSEEHAVGKYGEKTMQMPEYKSTLTKKLKLTSPEQQQQSPRNQPGYISGCQTF